MSTPTSPGRMALERPRRQLFGQGGHEPYARALGGGLGTLTLRPQRGNPAAAPVHFQVQDWCAAASRGEVALLRTSRGPVLDAGCGPGRMLAAAADLGLKAVGVDVSSAAVAQARSRGAVALNRSIFDALPYEGQWGTALLLDSNIGIGGDVAALLRRMAQLVSANGSVLVEVDPLHSMDLSYLAVLHGPDGRASGTFPWSRVGSTALATYAHTAGWRIAKTSTIDAISTQRATNTANNTMDGNTADGTVDSAAAAVRPDRARPAAEVVQDRVICRLVRRA